MIDRSTTLGWHWLFDLSGCSSIPHEPDELESLMLEAAKIAGATIVHATFHKFNPIGLSGVVVLAESHLAVHTWPEHRAVCVDLFSCTETLRVEEAAAFMRDRFGAERVETRHVLRTTQA